MKKLKALYIAGIMLLAFLIAFLSLHILKPSTSGTPEVDHYSVKVGNEYKVGFKIHNIGDRDEDYTFVLLLNGEKIGSNTVPIMANGTFEYTTYLPANKVGNGSLNLLIYRGKEKEQIDNITHNLIPEENA